MPITPFPVCADAVNHYKEGRRLMDKMILKQNMIRQNKINKLKQNTINEMKDIRK